MPRTRNNHRLTHCRMTGDLRFDLGLGAVANPDHGNNRADANNNAKCSEHRTHLVSAQRAISDMKCGSDAHVIR